MTLEIGWALYFVLHLPAQDLCRWLSLWARVWREFARRLEKHGGAKARDSGSSPWFKQWERGIDILRQDVSRCYFHRSNALILWDMWNV